ncbi:MAG: hypothetical protein QM780_04075 [Hyphomicrobium sp.]|uniref:hypothetical protein n=1 Tax=Hyphomicrobium sp. TaxID=82 RepID=UPI0039E5FFC8
MHHELVSRALAYVSCFSTASLLMTSMAIAAINVGRTPSLCAPHACVAGIVIGKDGQYGALESPAQIDALAAKLWSAKA